MAAKIRVRQYRRPERRGSYDAIYGKKNPKFEKKSFTSEEMNEFENEYEEFLKAFNEETENSK